MFFDRFFHKAKPPPAILDGCEYTSDSRPGRRSVLAAICGFVPLIGSTIARAFPNAPTWQTGYMYVLPGATVNTTVPNPTPYSLNNLNIMPSGNITTWNVTLPSQPFDTQIVTITQGAFTVTTLNIIPAPGTSIATAGQGAYQFVAAQSIWVLIQSFTVSGGGSGVGMQIVNSIAALQALVLNSSSSPTYLNSGARSGVFAPTTTDQSANVTADPAQGEWIAPAITPTGASGAWQRQWKDRADFGWWGFVLDGTFVRNDATWKVSSAAGTDNQANGAIPGWQKWAVRKTALGIPVYMQMTPQITSCMAWQRAGNGYYWFSGIYELDVDFRGCTMQQLLNADSSASCFPIAGTAQLNPYLINTTIPGNTIFTLVNATDQSNLAVGRYVMLASFDTQHLGFPPNCQYFQHVQIDAINAYAAASATSATYNTSTGIFALTFASAPFGAGIGQTLDGQLVTVSSSGASALNASWPISSTASSGTVINLQATAGLGSLSPTGGTIAALSAITLDRPIIHQHRSDFPDYNLGTVKCGAARVWTLDSGAAFVSGTSNSNWNHKHTYRNVDVNLPPNNTAPGNYATITGRDTTIINWRGAGFSPTIASNVHFIECTEEIGGEIDKLVEYVSYIRPKSPDTNINIQSATPRLMTIDGPGVIGGIVGSGQRLTCTGVDILSQFQIGPQYGLGGPAVFKDCLIGNTANLHGVYDGGLLLTIDGTIVQFSVDGVGVITLNLSALGGNISSWSAVPGMQLVLQATGSDAALLPFPGSIGVGNILSVTQDSPTSPTKIFINTDFPFTSLPTWAKGGINLMHMGPATFENCTGISPGGDAIRLAADAFAVGKRYFEYYRQVFSGGGAVGLEFFPQGILVSVECNVLSAGTTSGATLSLEFFTYDTTTSNFAADTPGYTAVTFNIGVKGDRVWTTTSAPLLGTDSLTVAGVTKTALPANRALFAVTGSVSANPGCQFELIITTNCGYLRKPLVTQLGGFATQGFILPVVGSLQ